MSAETSTIEEASGGMEDVVKVTVFITEMRLYDAIHEVRRRYFKEPFPASSTTVFTYSSTVSVWTLISPSPTTFPRGPATCTLIFTNTVGFLARLHIESLRLNS